MIAGVLVESAVRSLALGAVVGLGLWASRARGPRLRMMAWALVLWAALLMPLLMQWRTVEIRASRKALDAAPVIVRMVPIKAVSPVRPSANTGWRSVRWAMIVWRTYVAVALLLLFRVIVGLLVTFRLWNRAVPVREPGTRGLAVRETRALEAPATFGSGVLLPAEWRQWDELKRDAVLAHEREHVRWGDFYIQLLAQVHVAIFWFSPLAWWLKDGLARLAESASDDAALQGAPDCAWYAEILLQFARKPQRAPAAVAMARPRTVTARVERILSGGAMASRAGWRAYVLIAATTISAATLISGFSVRAQEPPSPPSAAGWPVAPPPPQAPQPPPPPASRNGGTWWWSSSEHHGDSYAIVSGDSLTMSGSMSDAERARSYRDRIRRDYIWFTHDGREYLITDPATVKRAQELFRPQEQLGRRQAELGEQQARLGEEQARLAERQSGVRVRMPDLDREIAEALAQIQIVKKQLRDKQQTSLADSERVLEKLENDLATEKGKDVSQDRISEIRQRLSEVQSRMSDELQDRVAQIQSRIGELQSQFGELESRAGDAQSKLGDEQSRLGEEQSRLGQQQSKLGEQQSRLKEDAGHRMRQLFNECLRNGLAKPAQ